VAVVYCGVVVTEKQWVHILRQAGLDEAKTAPFSRTNVAELAEILVGGSVRDAA
jgi:hypothetical protein